MEVEILYFVQEWYEDQDFARVTAPSRHLAQWLNHTIKSGILESRTSNSFARHIEDNTVGTADWPARNFEVSENFKQANYQVLQTAVNIQNQPTKVTQTTSTVEPSLIEPTHVINCLRPVHQPQRSHGQMDHGITQTRSLTVSWMGTFTRLVGTGDGYLDTTR